jgi:hypothetical protein
MNTDRLSHWGFFIALCLTGLVSGTAVANTAMDSEPSVDLQETQEVRTQTERYLVDRELLAEEWEQFTLHSARRPDVVVPLVLARIEAARKNNGSLEYIDKLANVVAYAGEEKAVEGLTLLALADENHFTPFLLAALGYAFDKGRGFWLAFSVSGRSQVIDDALAGWIATHTGQRRDVESLLSAISAWRGGNDLESVIATDHLLAKLPDQAVFELRAVALERKSRSQQEAQ